MEPTARGNSFQSNRQLAYGPTGPVTAPDHRERHYSSAAPTLGAFPRALVAPSTGPFDLSTPTRLPFFEAAIARSRGETVPDAPHFGFDSPDHASFRQPLPVYLPPPDPNHPDLAVGFTQSSTVRFEDEHNGRFTRAKSRSPSPGYDQTFDVDHGDGHAYGAESDVKKALLSDDESRVPGKQKWRHAVDEKSWSGQTSSFAFMGTVEECDLSLPPFVRSMSPSSQLPLIHVRGPAASTTDARSLSRVDGEMRGAETQHFGPAPSGRVGRRTHNAAGHRRIKQTATLDDNGFFAIDMPIPTRLAQFLPVKGVEEQKSTR